MTQLALVENCPPYRGMSEITPDLRAFGPMSTCPVCKNAWVQTCVTVDPETHAVAFVLLDGVCLECGALYRIATQADQIPRELPDVEEDEQ